MNYLNAFSVLSCNHLSYHKSVHWLFCSKSLDMKVYIKKTKLLTISPSNFIVTLLISYILLTVA